MLLLQKKLPILTLRFTSPLFHLRLIKDKYRENYDGYYWNVSAVHFWSSHIDASARAKKLAKINFTRYGNWLCTRWEEPRAEGQRVETLIRGAWNPTESLGSVEDVEHVARFLIIAPRMEQTFARSVARGARWDVRDIRAMAQRDRVMVIKKVFLRVCGAQ